MKNRAYKVVMSRGDDIPIDADELADIMQAIGRRTPTVVRSGIFNPAFFISIVEDRKRIEEWWNDTKHEPERRLKGMEPLKNIFEGVVIGSSSKKLLS